MGNGSHGTGKERKKKIQMETYSDLSVSKVQTLHFPLVYLFLPVFLPRLHVSLSLV